MFQNAPNQTTANNHNHQQITFPCWWYSAIASRMNEIRDSPSPKLVACFSANSRTPYQSWSVLISWFSTQKRCNTNRGWTSASHHCWEIWLRIGEKYNFPRNSFFQWRQSDRKARPSSSVMHLWSPKPTQDLIHICMRANPPKNASFKHFSLSWGPSKILQPLSEGRGNRLTICQIRS